MPSTPEIPVSGGDDSDVVLLIGGEQTDLNQGDSRLIVSADGADTIATEVFSIVGSGGTLLNGQATILDDPEPGFGTAECVGFVTVA
jgi:hypothetical protein